MCFKSSVSKQPFYLSLVFWYNLYIIKQTFYLLQYFLKTIYYIAFPTCLLEKDLQRSNQGKIPLYIVIRQEYIQRQKSNSREYQRVLEITQK